MTQVLLVRHAPTAATGRGAFAGDEAILEDGRRATAALRPHIPSADLVLSSPALRCRQTAAAAGLRPELDPRLAECDFGAWAGLTLAELHQSDPRALEGWMRDPDATPHGGESLRAFADRVGRWLDATAARTSGRILAVTHAGVVRAAVVRALAAPLEALWRVTSAPLSITELDAHEGTWTVVRVNWTAPA